MNYVIDGREPKSIFHFFEDICAIPHGSGNEKGIADYIQAFAQKRGLYCYRDTLHNVFIKKSATKGRENDPPLIFQAHTDMVCEKNDGTEHDFLKDPLKLYVDGKYLRAKGTTLGADDGIGVAVMLSLLDGEVESHPEIECLFTVSEETGMDGISGFDFSQIRARRMINLDSAEIDFAVAGCAGGVRSNVTFTGKREKYTGSTVNIKIKGLAGGHSGENIIDGRANAIKLMGRALLALGDVDFRLVSISGGGKSNAIPRECNAVLKTPEPDAVIDIIKGIEKDISFELGEHDRDFEILTDVIDTDSDAFCRTTTQKVISFIGTVANGVLEMSKKISGFVEYSRNLGVIRTEGDDVVITFFARSGIDAQLYASNREIEALAGMLEAKVEYMEMYGGWAYNDNSAIRDEYAKAYKKVTGKDITVIQLHAGLECGFISSNIPDMDIISVGPNVYSLHSPDECMDLDSVETLFAVLKEFLLK